MSRFTSATLVLTVVLLLVCLFGYPLEKDTFAQQSPGPWQLDPDDRAALPFRVYAQWAIDNYDSNNDGSLTNAEMKQMLSPLVEDRFDQDENGKLSFDEIVAAIRKPSAAKIEETTGAEPLQPRLPSKYVKYAQALINQYDQNSDHLLNSNETQKMRRPIAATADSNGDQQLSLHEIAHSLATASTTKPKQTPAIVVDPSLKLDAEELAKRFLQASLKKNDLDNDGRLSGNEIVSASWSGVRWQDSDTNNDGALSRDELLVRYRKMFSQFRQTTTRNPTTSETIQSDNRDMPPPSKTVDSAIARGKTPNDSVVDIKLFLLRLPANSTAQILTNSLDTLRVSKTSAHDSVKRLAQDLGLDTYDQLAITVVNQQTVKHQSGSSLPMITASTQNGRNRTVNQRFVEVGLSIQLTPEIIGNEIRLNLELDKSDLVGSGHEDNENSENVVVNCSLKATMMIEPGTPVMMGSSSSRQHWILVADAAIAD